MEVSERAIYMKGIQSTENKENKEMKITEKHIKNLLSESSILVQQVGAKTTLVVVTLPNGFELIESSSCVDPKNFDLEIGREIAIKKIMAKLWLLEGYLLQDKQSLLQDFDFNERNTANRLR